MPLLARRPFLSLLAMPWLGAAKPARAAIAPSDWQIFLHRHLRDQGRIVDDSNGQISHSEGQGFSLLCAEAADDLGSFLAILDWTNRVLQRPGDALFAWRFHPTRGVDDPNNATDGDLLIAWALLRGAERWRRADFAEQGRAIARDILRLLVRDVQGQIILLPGHRGFEQPHDIIINPSYYVFPALRALARAVPDPAWLRVVGDGLWLMRRSLFGRWGLPADWVALPRNGERPRPAPGWPARFSYDAVRVPLYLGWSGLTAEPPLQAAARFWAGDLARAPAWVDLATDAPAPYGASPGVRAIASFSVATGSEAARATQVAFPPIRESQAYYSAILGLLTRLAWRDFLQNRA